MKNLWKENKIQFPRLLVELVMAGAITEQVMTDLSKSMDLEELEIKELLKRAEIAYDAVKKENIGIEALSQISLDPVPLQPSELHGQHCPKCKGPAEDVNAVDWYEANEAEQVCFCGVCPTHWIDKYKLYKQEIIDE
jgi:hypothetical protein